MKDMRVRINFTPQSMDATRRAFQSVKKYGTNAGWSMLNRLTLFFAHSAIAGTPIAKRKREIFTPKTETEIRALGWRYAVKFPFGLTRHAERLGGPVEGPWIGTNSKSIAEEMADIWYFGAGKASWGGILVKMKATYVAASDRLGRLIRTSNYVIFNRAETKQSIVTINRYKIMNKIAPGIQDIALGKARARLEHNERRAFEAGISVAWRQAA